MFVTNAGRVHSMSVRRPNPATFDEMYRKYSRDVFQFVLYLSGDWAHAEDITAEVFLRLWTSETEIRTATLKSYLLTIARNLYLEQWRREKRKSALDMDVGFEGKQFEEAANRQEVERMMAALKQLPELERAALLLRAEDEHSYAVIGELLGIPEAAARMKVFRARLRLGELMERSKV